MNIIRIKKYIDDTNTDKTDKDRVIISNYDTIYTNIEEFIGKPMEYRNYK